MKLTKRSHSNLFICNVAYLQFTFCVCFCSSVVEKLDLGDEPHLSMLLYEKSNELSSNMAYRKQENKDGPTPGLIFQTDALTVIMSLFSIYCQECVTHLTLINRCFDIINYFVMVQLSTVRFILGTNHHRTPPFKIQLTRAFILLRRWPVQMKAF